MRIHEPKFLKVHHMFILLILAIVLVFGLNLLFFTVVEKNIAFSADAATQQQAVVIAPDEELEKEPADISEQYTVLHETIQRFENEQPVDVAVYFKDLETGYAYGTNQQVTFQSASLYKLFVAFEVLRQVDAGTMRLDEAAGPLTGTKSVEDCLRRTITISDNPCGRQLRDRLDAAYKPLPTLAEAGFVSTSLIHDYPTTSAQDVGLLFDLVYSKGTLSEEQSQRFFDYLLAQEINNRLPADLPSSVDVAHKTGDLEGYSHDGGIVLTGDGAYILVVLTGPWSNEYSEAPTPIANLSRQIYDNYVHIHAVNKD